VNLEKRREYFEAFFEKEVEITLTKGREYASDEDTNRNFKLIASIINQAAPLHTTCPECGCRVDYEISPLLVLVVYLFKHLLAIVDYLGREESLSDESLLGRLLDAVVYLKIYGGLAEELGGGGDVTTLIREV
jgi:hypothetical protein